MRTPYPSDVSREQFQEVEQLLEAARHHTKPRKLDLYEVFCGLLYVLRGGIQWRMLPREFPKWRSVYSYWQVWSEAPDGQPSVLDQCLKKIGWRHSHVPWEERQAKPLYY